VLLRLAQAIDWAIGWHRLPLPLGIAVLLAARKTLRRWNLFEDGSQIYGSGADMLAQLRSGDRGKLKVQPDGLLPLDDNGIDLTGVNGNWWLGLSLMQPCSPSSTTRFAIAWRRSSRAGLTMTCSTTRD
jgi:hypothetical protein